MKLSDLQNLPSGKQVKTACPKCEAEKHRPGDTSLSVNTETGLYFCHRCDQSGRLDEYKSKIPVDDGKEYSLPKLNTTGLGEDQLNWLKGRGISVSTVNRNKITQSPKGWIEFNYYEDNELVNIKYRSITSKRFMQHKGGKPVLYGLMDIVGQEKVIIVEGEIDKLSMEEAGYKNCVSVPLGAMNPNDKNISAKLKCFEYAVDYLDAASQIIIAVDNDDNGKRLKDEIARRFGKHICKWVDFGQYKDANEVLTDKGPEYLKSLVIQARDFPINNIADIDDILGGIVELYQKGLPPAFNVGMGDDFNKLYKVKEGYLTVVTGIPSHGKSVFIENIMVNMIRQYGWKFGVYSPEHYPFSLYFQRIARIYTGKQFFNTGKSRMNQDELTQAVLMFKDHIFPMTEDSGKSLDDILETFEQAIFKYGIKGIIIDPWTELVHDMGTSNETKYISDSLAKIKRFNHKHDVHTWVIAHPTKMQKKEKSDEFYVPTMYSISGSANWYNRTDMGIAVYRHQDNRVEVFVQKVKQEGIYGSKGSTVFNYDRDSCRYSNFIEYTFDDEEVF